MTHYYETTHANVHRGVYATAEEATALYERARVVAGRFVGAPGPGARGRLHQEHDRVAQPGGASPGAGPTCGAGDAVLLTEMEHHANIVPWMILSEELGGLDLRYIPIDDDGRLVLDDLDRLVDGVKLVGVSAMSNVLGTINPVRRHRRGGPRAPAPWWWPTAPSSSRTRRSTCATLGVDFLAFSAHKMMGPTGIGVLWGRAELLDAMPPFLGGGGMILDVQARRASARRRRRPASRPARRPSPRRSG